MISLNIMLFIHYDILYTLYYTSLYYTTLTLYYTHTHYLFPLAVGLVPVLLDVYYIAPYLQAYI